MVAEALKNARKQSKSESRKDIPADINALGRFLFPYENVCGANLIFPVNPLTDLNVF